MPQVWAPANDMAAPPVSSLVELLRLCARYPALDCTKGTKYGDKGTDNGDKGTDNGDKGTDNGDKGTDNGDKGTEHRVKG
jgi:hypothetical protein